MHKSLVDFKVTWKMKEYTFYNFLSCLLFARKQLSKNLTKYCNNKRLEKMQCMSFIQEPYCC